MLIAQALGEYVAVASLVEAYNYATVRVEEVAGEWGTEGLVILIVVAVLWKLITANR